MTYAEESKRSARSAWAHAHNAAADVSSANRAAEEYPIPETMEHAELAAAASKRAHKAAQNAEAAAATAAKHEWDGNSLAARTATATAAEQDKKAKKAADEANEEAYQAWLLVELD
jgi:hypothetical protein